MGQRHLLFIDLTLPMPGFGESVVFYRHLKRLKGWKITIIVSEYTPMGKEYEIPDSWRIIVIPLRKRWWPPFHWRVPASFLLRFFLLKLECERLLNKEKPSTILNVLGRNSGLAYYLSKAWKVPLFMHIADRWQVWVETDFDKLYMTEKRAISILNHASRIFATSPRLAAFYKVNNPKKTSAIFPIPEEEDHPCFIQWRDDFKIHPVMVSSGSFRDYQIDIFRNVSYVLQKMNGSLLIITNRNNDVKSQLKNLSNVVYQEPFVKGRELISFLREKASCILIPGSFRGELDWKINMPARLVEFSHLGIPMIILSPPRTCLSDWAKAHQWHGHSDTLDNDRVFKLVKQVTDKDTWFAMAEQSKNVALNEFNPDKIQSQFESELEATLVKMSI